MADNKDKLTPDEVRQTVLNNGVGTTGMANPNGYQQVSPVDVNAGTPQSSSWRNVQATGNAKTDYNAILNANPGAYQGMYQQPMNQTMNNLLGQKPFQYNVNTDALYQQIKDNYIKQGRQAMMNTQGQAAALTGGYGNSYGALAGQQAYQESLGNLSAQIPELYQLAYNKYLNNENSQRQNLAALQGLDESEYQRYQYDTQQYESKLADLYAKYEKSKSGGGGGKKSTLSSYMNDVYAMYSNDEGSYNSQTGLKGDAGVDAAVAAGAITKEYGDALKQGGKEMTGYQDLQQRKQTAEDTVNEVLNWFGIKK